MKSVEKEFESYEDKSRILFWLAIVLIICSGVFSGINFVWANLLSSIVFFFALTAVLISFMYPGILVIFGKPWFAQAWLRGINPSSIPEISWDSLPVGKKNLVYFYSITGFVFGILAIIIIILNKGY